MADIVISALGDAVQSNNFVGVTGIPGSHNHLKNNNKNKIKCPFMSDSISGITKGVPNWLQQTGIRSLFGLEHNRIAEELYKNNSDWTDEKLFYESRARVIALYQYVIYNEYLPLLLGL